MAAGFRRRLWGLQKDVTDKSLILHKPTFAVKQKREATFAETLCFLFRGEISIYRKDKGLKIYF